MKITASFSVSEFACHDGTPYPVDKIETLRELCMVLEAVRAEFNRPMVIISGYRTPEHNTAVGGEDDSRHMHADAADVAVVNVPAIEVHRAVLDLYRKGHIPKLGGLGKYTGWTHIDIRQKPEDGHLCRWMGRGVRK